MCFLGGAFSNVKRRAHGAPAPASLYSGATPACVTRLIRVTEILPMSVAAAFDPTTLTLTERAVYKVRELIGEEANQDLKLRVFITGGGCSGFQYGFSFDEDAADDDTRIEREGVVMLVDSMSFPYLAGSEVDYTEGLEGSRFIVNNPNATTTCGCGASFSV